MARLPFHLALSLALGFSATTGAGERDGSTEPLKNWEAFALVDKHFQALDCENIGRFPPEEVSDHIGQVWLPVTAGRVQEVPVDTYAKFHHKVPDDTASRLFADADRDADGLVTFVEIEQQLMRLIEQLDLDGDGLLQRDELNLSEPGQPRALDHGAANAHAGPAQEDRNSEQNNGHAHEHTHVHAAGAPHANNAEVTDAATASGPDRHAENADLHPVADEM